MLSSYSCPICKNFDGNHVLDERLNVSVCTACSHVFSVNTLSSETLYSPDYFLNEHKNWFLFPNFKLFGKIVSDIKNNFANRSVNVLDVGCGRGDFLKFLHQQRPEYNLCGIDVTPNSDPGITYLQGDFVEYHFDAQFNVIVGLMVIEHISDPVAFVKKIHALLSPDGRVFLVTITNNSLLYRLSRFFKKIGWRAPFDRLYHPHHLQHYTNASLRRLMEQNGFSVETQYNHNFPLSAVDLPPGPKWVQIMYFSAVACLFGLTNLVGSGLNQTIVCKIKSESGQK